MTDGVVVPGAPRRPEGAGWRDAASWNDADPRIIIDCRYVRTTRHDGISRFSERLAAEASVHVPVTMLVSDLAQLPMLPDLPWVLGPSPTSALEPVIAARFLNELEPDVVFTPMQTMGPIGRRYRLITTIHDLIYYDHPTPPRDLPVAVRALWRIYHLTYGFQRALLNRADGHVTISQTTAADLERHRMTRRPVTVIPNGVDHPVDVRPRTAPDLAADSGRTLVYMGSFMPYKNVETLARALHELPGYRLELLSRCDDTTRARLEALAPAESLVFRGGVSDAEYAEALTRARALVTASKSEGFGLPVAEAMAAATPVVVADIPIFREVAGEHAEFADPDDPAAFAAAVRRLEDPAAWEDRSADSLAWSRRYDWATGGATLAELLIDESRRARRSRASV